MHPALFFTRQPGNKVHCALCPHRCSIAEGSRGICRVRQNHQGVLYALAYGAFTSINLDPIEKKPLYHFYPKSHILSVGTVGCNFRCGFCQNWEISQAEYGALATEPLSAADAEKLARANHSIGIAYTYNEPLINYEWVRETAAHFNKKGLKNVLVTNGYINPEPWKELLPYIDAANIDIKSMREEFYVELCKGHIAPVLESVKTMSMLGKHVEITNLLIPGKNDSSAEIHQLVDWIAELNPAIPLHFSRYFPRYHMHAPMTEQATLQNAYAIAKKKLRNVYLGNVS